MARLGVGVIGVGTFGNLHARTYRDLDMCELKAVADVSQERLDVCCRDLQADGYADYQELLAREDIDAVSICTTDELHVEPALAAAAAGKHMFIEKPLAMTVDDCDTIIAAAQSAGVKLTVGHILRFDPRYIVAYQKIANGEIGQLVHMCVRRNNPLSSSNRLSMHTSVLFFLGVHDLDFLNWCAGTKPDRVYAQAVSRVLTHTPDTVLAVLRFPDGSIASLEACWVIPQSFDKLDAKFEAVGTDGAIYVDGGRRDVLLFRERVEYPDYLAAPELLGERGGSLRDELNHWLVCVARGGQPRVSPEDARAAVVVAKAMEESYRTGMPVDIA